MADIALTAAQIAPIYPAKAEIYDFVAAVDLTPGAAVYLNSNGKVDLADANGSGTLQLLGVAMKTVKAGQVVPVLKRGAIYGLTVSGLAYYAQVMLSATAGALADSGTIIIGRVIPIPDKDLTKVTFIDVDWVPTRS